MKTWLSQYWTLFGVPGEDGGAPGGGEAGDGGDTIDGVAEGVGLQAAVGRAEEVEVAGELGVGDIGFDGGGVGVPETGGVAEHVELERLVEGGLEDELLAFDALEVGVVFAVAAEGDGVVAVEVVEGTGREFDPDGVDVVVRVVPRGDGEVRGDIDVDAAEGIDEEFDTFEIEDDVVIDFDAEVELEVGFEFFDAAFDGAGGADAVGPKDWLMRRWLSGARGLATSIQRSRGKLRTADVFATGSMVATMMVSVR
ncbi:DUF2283 domain-containing protein [Tepidiforma flava]|uniref:DUF2283 domain-containing protein n=1 Tax=Tepidiforma flava TaxID=3004094 RepID=A0ABY7M3S7_9CHLR|nr:DUF2283 domain-containing protein [Tepidiforma flava]WBL35225.1 DUF2283 domain-containing protein [Tepidiforma flava]